MAKRLFISYRRNDAARVDALVAALEAEGVEVWIDCRKIDDAASIQARIDQGLASAHALLAWYSADYPKSRACQWELTAGLIAASAETAPVKRILVINPEPEATHIQPLQVRDLQHHAADNDLARLAQAIAEDLAPIQGEMGALRHLARPPTYGFTPLGSNRFVGRLDKLWQIHSTLSAGQFAIVSGLPSPNAAGDTLQVRGSGGIGKSMLAEEYALRFGACWPGGVFWLRAYGNSDNPDETEEQLAERRRLAYDSQWESIATRLGLDTREQTTAQLRAAVARKLTQPYLWIVDDLPDCGREEFERWLAPNSTGQSLVTTRSRRLDGVGQSIDLSVLAPEDSRALLTLDQAPIEEDEGAAERILNLLDGHALALDIARAACRRLGYATFLERLESPDQDALTLAATLAPELPNGHNPHIAVTFLGSIKQLDEQGRDCLALATHLAPSPIPFELVVNALAHVDGINIDRATDRAAQGVQQLLDNSLADETQGPGAFSIHSLLRLSTHHLELATPIRSEHLMQGAFAALNYRMQLAADIRKHVDLTLILPHATWLTEEVKDADSATLAGWIARYEFEAGRYKTAARWRRAECEWRTEALGKEHPDTQTSMSNLAHTLSELGDYAGARRLQEQVLALRQQTLGDEHPETLTLMSNLAAILSEQGEHAGARVLLERVLVLRKHLLGDEHPENLTTMNNLAITLRVQGDYTAAQELQEHTITLGQQVLGDSHPDILRFMSNLATTLRHRGAYTDARALQEQVLDHSRRMLGNEHPFTLTSMNNLATILSGQGDHNATRALHEQVIALSVHLLGDEHPHTLTSMSNLASTLSDQGNHAAARELQEQVLEIRRRTLGDDHPDTLVGMSNLASSLWALGDHADARIIQEKVLAARQHLLGNEHPQTLNSMNLLAASLTVQGEYLRARPLLEEVLTIRQRMLGTRHPSTTHSAWNLFATCAALSEDLAAKLVANEFLYWLVDQDPSNLGADQGQVRELFIKWQKRND